MKKNFFLMLFFIISLTFYNCGGGSGGGSGSSNLNNNLNVPPIPNIVKSSSSATVNEVSNSFSEDPNLKDKDIYIDETSIPSDTPLKVFDNNYVYTYSNNGIIVKVPIPESIKENLDPKDLPNLEVDNITQVFDELQQKEKNYPYVLGILKKTVKKPFCYEDNTNKKTVCIIIDNLKNLKKDLTIAVVPYGSLLALPNNGVDILNKYYVPISRYSADILVEDSKQNRYSIKEIENIFNNDKTTLTLYVSYPYDENLKNVFDNNTKYKIFLLKAYDNGTNYLEEQPGEVNIVEKIKDKVIVKALYENKPGFYPFIIARKMNTKQIRKVEGKVNNLKNLPIIVEACSQDSEVDDLKNCTIISVGNIGNDGNYSFVYEKPYDKKVFAKIESQYLEKPIIIEVNDNESLEFPPQFTPKDTYPSYTDLSPNDKLFLSFLIYNTSSLFYENVDNGYDNEIINSNYQYLKNPPYKLGELLKKLDYFFSESVKNQMHNFLNNSAQDNNTNTQYLKDGKCSYSLNIKNQEYFKLSLNCNSLSTTNTTYNGNVQLEIKKDPNLDNKFYISIKGNSKISSTDMDETDSIDITSNESWVYFSDTQEFEDHKKDFKINFSNNKGENSNIAGTLSIYKNLDKYYLSLSVANYAQYSNKCSIKWNQLVIDKLNTNLNTVEFNDITTKVSKVELKPGNGEGSVIKDSDIFNILIKRSGYNFNNNNYLNHDNFYLVNNYEISIPKKLDLETFKSLFCNSLTQ